MRTITTTEELALFCEAAKAQPYVTIDTEFLRERTYWSKLCLIQMALPGTEGEAVLVDPIEGGDALSLAPLYDLFRHEATVKVFHAARQDLEIFFVEGGVFPQPLFDTQVAAMVAGYGDQVSYDGLCRSLAGAAIDKAHRFSDWSARPLSAAQQAYAAADVTHLRKIYTALDAKLRREGRLAWVAEELAALADPATYRTEPEAAWERLRPRTGNRRFLGVLKAVAAWREREAQRINIQRQRLVKDETLLEIAATAPETVADLSRARGISEGFAKGRSGAGLLAAVKAGKEIPDEALPEAPKDRAGPTPSPALVALLKVLLAAKSEEHHVAPRLLASSEDLDHLAAGDAAEVPALHGWRREVFGDAALALKAGRLALGVDGKRVKLIPAG